MFTLRSGTLSVIAVLLVFACAPSQATAQNEELKPLRYLNPSEVNRRVLDLSARAQRPGFRVEVIVIGKSIQGRDILALEIAETRIRVSDEDRKRGVTNRSAGKRPATLIVAGLEAHRLVGTSVSLEMARRMLDLDAKTLRETLAGTELYFIPLANPDGAVRYFEIPRVAHAGNARVLDWDRDARTGAEDGPSDLDGDGLITSLRRLNERGDWKTDADDARRLVKADPKKGENGRYEVHPEGLDRDRDGEVAENPPFGVNIDRNFPRDFRENDLASGLHPISEPESRALIDYVLARRNIAMTIAYSGHDNLGKVPKAAKNSSGGGRRRAAAKGLWDEDRAILESVRGLRKESKAVLGTSDRDEKGSFSAWSYYQFGAQALAINLFQVPEAWPEEKKSDEKKSGKAEAKKKDSIEAERRERHQSAWSPWKAVEHPSLGAVEVGGWKPFLRENPSPQVAAEIADREFEFMRKLLAMRARLKVDEPELKRLSPGLYEIRLRVSNDGALPTATQQGAYSREVGPVLIEIDLPKERIVQGRARSRVDRLREKSGERHERWLVRGKKGDVVVIRIAEPRSEAIRLEVTLP